MTNRRGAGRNRAVSTSYSWRRGWESNPLLVAGSAMTVRRCLRALPKIARDEIPRGSVDRTACAQLAANQPNTSGAVCWEAGAEPGFSDTPQRTDVKLPCVRPLLPLSRSCDRDTHR